MFIFLPLSHTGKSLFLRHHITFTFTALWIKPYCLGNRKISHSSRTASLSLHCMYDCFWIEKWLRQWGGRYMRAFNEAKPSRYFDSAFFSCFGYMTMRQLFCMSKLCGKYFQLDLMSSHEWKECLQRHQQFSTLPRFINCIKNFTQSRFMARFMSEFYGTQVMKLLIKLQTVISNGSTPSLEPRRWKWYEAIFLNRKEHETSTRKKKRFLMCVLLKIAHFQNRISFCFFLDSSSTAFTRSRQCSVRWFQVLLNCDHIK